MWVYIFNDENDYKQYEIGFFDSKNEFIVSQVTTDEDYAIEMVSFLNGGVINPRHKKPSNPNLK